jgi:hypothetical protein
MHFNLDSETSGDQDDINIEHASPLKRVDMYYDMVPSHDRDFGKLEGPLNVDPNKDRVYSKIFNRDQDRHA